MVKRTMIVVLLASSLLRSSLMTKWDSMTYEEKISSDDSVKAIVADMTTVEFDLMSRVVEAESDRGTSEDSFEGRVLIALTILNRVNDSGFNNTIAGVIYESGQFQVVETGAVWSVGRTDLSDLAVIEARQRLESGEAPNVLYFNNSGYSYGTAYGYFGGNYFVTN